MTCFLLVRSTFCEDIVHNHCVYMYNVSFFYLYFNIQLHTYLVMDLLEGGELLDKIRTQAKFTEAEASRIMRSLVTAVDFLHSNGIIHRDLKPEVRFLSLSIGSDPQTFNFKALRLILQSGHRFPRIIQLVFISIAKFTKAFLNVSTCQY